VGRVARRASAPAANAYRPQAAALMHPPVSVGFVATHMATCYPKCRLLAIISSEMQCCIGGSTMVESASRLCGLTLQLPVPPYGQKLCGSRLAAPLGIPARTASAMRVCDTG